jgi:hypothetical protein
MLRYTGGSWGLFEEKVEMKDHQARYIPNFLRWLNAHHIVQTEEKVLLLDLADDRLFNYPLLFITGHYSFELNEKERSNLKTHLENGGLLWIEDCGGLEKAFARHGKFSDRSRKLMKEIFPDGEFQVLPFDHDLYQFPFSFPRGLPPLVGRNNDQSGNPDKVRKLNGGEGFFTQGRLLAFYSDADMCCEWRHNGKEPSKWGDTPFKMGANIVVHAMTH